MDAASVTLFMSIWTILIIVMLIPVILFLFLTCFICCMLLCSDEGLQHQQQRVYGVADGIHLNSQYSSAAVASV